VDVEVASRQRLYRNQVGDATADDCNSGDFWLFGG
jgi:hypothetical protein